MVRASCFKINTNTSTPTTALSVKTNTFTAAADGGAGVNIIHPRALQRLISSNNVELTFYDCKYRLIVANQSVVEVTQEVRIPFKISEVSEQEFYQRFLITETPFDFILSHSTLEHTGLG